MTLTSQGLVLTAAMVLSSCPVLYLALSSKIISPPSFISGNSNSQDSGKQILRSCLRSEENKVQRNKKKKKKKVKFADNVKEASDGAEKEQGKQNRVSRSCRDEMEEIMAMPANRFARYNGILRDRVRKIECP